jgi:hypothetical protein
VDARSSDRGLGPAATRASPGQEPDGPFSRGDLARTAELLSYAGWEEPTAIPFERTVTVERTAILITTN